jgi:hypothetical protein
MPFVASDHRHGAVSRALPFAQKAKIHRLATNIPVSGSNTEDRILLIDKGNLHVQSVPRPVG